MWVRDVLEEWRGFFTFLLREDIYRERWPQFFGVDLLPICRTHETLRKPSPSSASSDSFSVNHGFVLRKDILGSLFNHSSFSTDPISLGHCIKLAPCNNKIPTYSRTRIQAQETTFHTDISSNILCAYPIRTKINRTQTHKLIIISYLMFNQQHIHQIQSQHKENPWNLNFFSS